MEIVFSISNDDLAVTAARVSMDNQGLVYDKAGDRSGIATG